MSDREMLDRALADGDATAFLALADQWQDEGRPEADELSALAVMIRDEQDWALVQMAGVVFLTLLQTVEGDA